MDSKYCISIVFILSLLTFAMFCRDALKEHFDNTNQQIGKCMNLYSKSLLTSSGVDVIDNPGNRSYESCPQVLCQYSDSLKKCIPTADYTNNQAIHDYCQKEQYIENISNEDLCKNIGYTWKNGICNPSVKRTENDCPTNKLCQWNNDTNECNSKSIGSNYPIDDYDSVEDYCNHLKSLSPMVSKETCQSAGEAYNYDDLRKKCINIDINSQNINDTCWGNKTLNDCMNEVNTDTQCIWMSTLPKVANANDIKNLRESELITLDGEADKLDKELQTYISSVAPYQEKIDTEQAASLIIKIIDADNKSRFQLETGLDKYQNDYQASLTK